MNIRQLNLYWIRSRLGLVAQEPVLFDLTIAQNIAYGLENISEEQIRDAAIKANIHEFIQMLPNVKYLSTNMFIIIYFYFCIVRVTRQK